MDGWRQVLTAAWYVRYPVLFIEATAATLAAMAVPAWLGVTQIGMFALFLVAASLFPRFEHLLDENRTEIYARPDLHVQTNLLTAVSIATQFLGICAGFLLVALWLPESDIRTFFGFALEAAGLTDDTLLDRSFHHLGGILFHNLSVLCSVTLLCLLYRSYGALIALGWNACQWVFVMVTLTRRATDLTEMSPALLSTLTLLATLPHFITEAVAYVLGSLAGIFISKAVFRHGLGGAGMVPVLSAVARMLGWAIALLIIAAGLETTLIPSLQVLVTPIP